MADFSHEFWNWFIAVPVVLGLLYCVFLIRANTIAKPKENEDGEVETVGHVWDGDLQEYNNPMPRWWLNLFYITLVFAVIYLLLFPGLGSFQGLLGWSSEKRYTDEVAAAEASYAPLYASYLAQPIDQLAKDREAMGTAKRLYGTNCAICHGADARGYVGFPNLTDHDWLWGGDETTVKATLVSGRQAVMPAWSSALGERGVNEVSEYVFSLTREPINAFYVAPGKQKYAAMCAACHGANGEGNPALGAPNLADEVWLYGSSISDIRTSVAAGRNGIMPAFGEKLTEAQIHLLAAYLRSQRPVSNKTAE